MARRAPRAIPLRTASLIGVIFGLLSIVPHELLLLRIAHVALLFGHCLIIPHNAAHGALTPGSSVLGLLPHVGGVTEVLVRAARQGRHALLLLRSRNKVWQVSHSHPSGTIPRR